MLADTLSIRICKLLLYADDGAGAAGFFRRHLARFTELSTGWGIGAMTFEYWSWLSKQYRMFGELVEHATRVNAGSALPPFQLPAHAPPLPSKLLHPGAVPRFTDGRGEVHPPPGLLLPNQNAVAVSILPSATLASPATYYYLAALCTIERRARFLRIASSTPASNETEDSSPLSHERKFDHTAQLTETLTKAYDAFKKARQNRAALFVAARIATAYFDGGKDEMASKFLERILRSYKKDEVQEVRAGLVEVAVQAAVNVGDGRAAVKVLNEVLDPSLPVVAERRREMVDALKTFLAQATVGVNEVTKEDDAEEAKEKDAGTAVPAAFLDVAAVFPAAEVEFAAEVPFQVVVRNTSAFDLREVFSIECASLHLHCGEDAHETLIDITSSSSSDGSEPAIVDLGKFDGAKTAIAGLTSVFAQAGVVAVQGAFTPSKAGNVTVGKVVLHAKTQAGLAVQLELLLPEHPSDPTDTDAPSSGLNVGQWLLPSGRKVNVTQRANPSITLVRPKRMEVALTASTSLPSDTEGFVDERISIVIKVLNQERDAVYAWIDASLQPSYDGAKDTLEHEGMKSEGQAVKGVKLGEVEAGKEAETVVWLTPAHRAGLRTIDVSLRVATSADEVEYDTLAVTAATSLSIPVAQLFGASTWTKSLSPAKTEAKQKALLDFVSDDEDVAETRSRVGLDVQLLAETEAGVEVTAVDLVSNSEAVGTAEEAEEEQEALGLWYCHDRFSFTRAIPLPSATLCWRISWKRPSSSIANTSLIPLSPPPAQLPTSSTGLTLTLTYAATQHLHHPFDLSLEIQNHHPSRSYSLVLTLDSDEHFTASGTRRLTLPYLLPHQRKVMRNFARLVPQTIGKVRVPNIAVRVIDPQAAAGVDATLAVIDSNDRRAPRQGLDEEETEDEEWKRVVRFAHRGGEGEEVKDVGEMGLPRILVRL